MKRLILTAAAIFLALAAHAAAAPLNYTNSTNILLTAPGVTLTIATNSVADALTVNATSVTVTLSNTTGGTFTLVSPQALSSSTVRTGGTVTQTCASGIETDTITQLSGSETYTLTPTGSACASPAPAPSGGSGGGGGGVSTGGGGSAYDLSINNGAPSTATPNVALSLYGTVAYTMEISNTSGFASSTWIPYVTSLPWTLASGTGEQTVYAEFRSVSGSIVGSAQASIALLSASGGTDSSPTAAPTASSPTSTASLLAELQSLEAELAALQAQAAQTTPPHFVFTRDLSLWSTGNDVKALQQYLIAQASGLAAEKLKAHGTTTIFGLLTYRALVKFQEHVGILPASGYFGPKTRAYVNAHD